jgi:hypothetical protein
MVLETNDSGVDIRGDDRSGLMHLVLNSTGIAYFYLVEFDRVWSQTTPPVENGGPEEPEEPGGNGHVVINEVEANPAGIDTGNEWVELYNPTRARILGDHRHTGRTDARARKSDALPFLNILFYFHFSQSYFCIGCPIILVDI